MLKQKLAQKSQALEHPKSKVPMIPGAAISPLFAEPVWVPFYEAELQLNKRLATLEVPPTIAYTYNPVEYASSVHLAYLRRFLNGTKRIIFIGMNPGPNGMGQTGVPFGNVCTVRDVMQLSGEVTQPNVLHPKRPVNGFNTSVEEPSGVRLWQLFERLASGSLDTFSQQCFVHNFCPLLFFDEKGRNITPSELKGTYKQQIREMCLNALGEQLQLLQPQIVVAVGDYVYTALKRSSYSRLVSVIRLPHPSPRSRNNTNWPEKALDMLVHHDIIKFMRNEA